MTIRFAGDSGDGMQLTGSRFTSETAALGNDLSTLPDFPAEIRAPAGSLPGVSGFQIHFADHDILTPGDQPDVLVAMNPAALKTNFRTFAPGGHADRQPRRLQRPEPPEGRVHVEPARGRLARGLQRARDPAHLDDGRGAEGDRGRHVARGGALEELLRARADVVALRPADRGHARLHRDEVREAPGARRGEHARVQGRLPLRRDERGLRRPVRGEAGEARARASTASITGNQALSLGLVAASVQQRPRLFLGAYPITPASGILEELARYKQFGVRTFQAEDEIAAAGAALGASFGGALGVTTSAGPGHRAQVGDRRARRRARAAARDRRRAARRAVDGHADEARAGRPADGAVRPELGVARARARRLDAPATASTMALEAAASRSRTGRPSTCSRTRTSRTAPSRG